MQDRRDGTITECNGHGIRRCNCVFHRLRDARGRLCVLLIFIVIFAASCCRVDKPSRVAPSVESRLVDTPCEDGFEVALDSLVACTDSLLQSTAYTIDTVTSPRIASEGTESRIYSVKGRIVKIVSTSYGELGYLLHSIYIGTSDLTGATVEMTAYEKPFYLEGNRRTLTTVCRMLLSPRQQLVACRSDRCNDSAAFVHGVAVADAVRTTLAIRNAAVLDSQPTDQ